MIRADYVYLVCCMRIFLYTIRFKNMKLSFACLSLNPNLAGSKTLT